MAEEVKVPDAPELLPAAEQKKWKARYAEGYKQALIDTSGNEAESAQRAAKYANQMLRVPEIEDFESAAKMPEWMFLKRDETSGKVVTIDGKKYEFDPPKPKTAKKQDAGTAA